VNHKDQVRIYDVRTGAPKGTFKSNKKLKDVRAIDWSVGEVDNDDDDPYYDLETTCIVAAGSTGQIAYWSIEEDWSEDDDKLNEYGDYKYVRPARSPNRTSRMRLPPPFARPFLCARFARTQVEVRRPRGRGQEVRGPHGHDQLHQLH
jgi:hypothetical protein